MALYQISLRELFAKFTGSRFATTVSSCTAGMHLFYLANKIKTGDEVIVTSRNVTFLLPMQ